MTYNSTLLLKNMFLYLKSIYVGLHAKCLATYIGNEAEKSLADVVVFPHLQISIHLQSKFITMKYIHHVQIVEFYLYLCTMAVWIV